MGPFQALPILLKDFLPFLLSVNFHYSFYVIFFYFRPLSFIGLFLIAVGTGGIKPCVASFGGEQFKLPEQQDYMKTYFSLFYAAINSGSLISTLLTPILRQEVSCAKQETW